MWSAASPEFRCGKPCPILFRCRRRRGAGGLAPDDLRQRLKEGKVYIAGQAERAIEHFFRKGNLIALRELALRRTADRVDEQMRAWRGILAKRKSGTHATRSYYASGITPAVRNWSARRRGWPRAWAVSGTRCMLKPLPCIAYRRKTSGNSQRLTSGAGAGRGDGNTF